MQSFVTKTAKMQIVGPGKRKTPTRLGRTGALAKGWNYRWNISFIIFYSSYLLCMGKVGIPSGQRMPQSVKPRGEAMTQQLRTGMITFSPGLPMQISEEGEDIAQSTGVQPISLKLGENMTEDQASLIRQAGAAISAYLKGAKESLSSKYPAIGDMAPEHLRNPGNVLVICCPEGVLVRYDRNEGEHKVFATWFPGELSEIVTTISQGVVHCHPTPGYVSSVAASGLELRLLTSNPVTGEQSVVMDAKLGFEATFSRSPNRLSPPVKPFRLMSVQSSLEIQLLGVLMEPGKSEQNFLARTSLHLPVGWDCIEVFPFADLDSWKPEYAPLWAENDLLASVAALQVRRDELRELDPNVAARKEFATLLEAYKKLLDSNPDREETLQVFLQKNPSLLNATHTRCWPKFALGPRTTDFVFRGADGDYQLVELEKSTDRLFIKSGHMSANLNHAYGQILDWKRYLEDNLKYVQGELGLTDISSNPNGLIVIGRSRDLTQDNRRKLVAAENDRPKVKVMTYDDVHDNAKAVAENLLGPLWQVTGATEIYYLPSE